MYYFGTIHNKLIEILFKYILNAFGCAFEPTQVDLRV